MKADLALSSLKKKKNNNNKVKNCRIRVNLASLDSYCEIFWSKAALKCFHEHNVTSVSSEIFDWGFLYLLTGKVRGTKSEMRVQEF